MMHKAFLIFLVTLNIGLGLLQLFAFGNIGWSIFSFSVALLATWGAYDEWSK